MNKKGEEQKKKIEPYLLPYTKICIEINHRLKCKSWKQENSREKKITTKNIFSFAILDLSMMFYIGYKEHETLKDW